MNLRNSWVQTKKPKSNPFFSPTAWFLRISLPPKRYISASGTSTNWFNVHIPSWQTKRVLEIYFLYGFTCWMVSFRIQLVCPTYLRSAFRNGSWIRSNSMYLHFRSSSWVFGYVFYNKNFNHFLLIVDKFPQEQAFLTQKCI